MIEQKEFSIESILSFTTGKLLCNFKEVHELAEYIIGRPFWTHEFTSDILVKQMQNAIFQQYPELVEVDVSLVNRENIHDYVTKIKIKYGDTKMIKPGTY